VFGDAFLLLRRQLPPAPVPNGYWQASHVPSEALGAPKAAAVKMPPRRGL